MPKPRPYLECQTHILLDMHIPDWDERFLSKFDPSRYVELCAEAGAEAVMFYCNSHAGQCYWPTTVGQVHRSLGERDLVGECVALLRERGIAVCAYYSAIFNNWAYTKHPEWRLVASAPGGVMGPGSRYGQCCPANPEYLEFMRAQTEELASGYPFDAFFFDMVFWPDVCVCDSCRERYREEEGAEIPTTVNWTDREWCRFQATRQRWLADAFRTLRNEVKRSLTVPVFLNSALFELSWIGGSSPEIMALNDLVGGDFWTRTGFDVSIALSRSLIQHMYAVSGYGGGASDLTPLATQQIKAMETVAFGGQFMAIDAVEPDGSLSPPVYRRLATVFDSMRPYRNELGGRPLADIGVYHSPDSQVALEPEQVQLDALPPGAPEAPVSRHWHATAGALRALGEVHLPVAAVTRADLDRLGDFRVLVLPELLRIDVEEAEAMRRYVAEGGRLYASGRSSLLQTDGRRHDDFLLADLFGAHRRGEAPEAVVYFRPLAAAVGSELGYIAIGEPFELERSNLRPEDSSPPVLEIAADASAEVLASVTTPYRGGYGSRDDEDWANIHSAPPWEDTDRPAVVRNRFGKGETIYAATALEAARGRLAGNCLALFVALVRSLLARPPRFEAEAHPAVWATAFEEPGRNRIRLSFVNASQAPPPLPIPRIGFRLAPPEGSSFTALRRLPAGGTVGFERDADGTIRAELRDLELFEMLAAEYEASE